MENCSDIIDVQLLHSYLKGEVDAEEIRKIEAWLDNSDENKKILREYSFLEYAVNVVAHSKPEEISKSLQEVKQRIRKNKFHHLLSYFQRIAAILFLPALLLSGFMIYRHLKNDDPLQYVEINSISGVITSIYLPDSTKVWLNSDSYLKYPVHFSGNRRDVSLRGEAYFSVSHDKEKPFIVKINDDCAVKVLGTEFNIDAYPDKPVFTTTLVKGSVELVSANDEKNVQVKMLPNEQINYNRNTKSFERKNVNTLNYTSWKDNKIMFKDHPINEILKLLSKRYNAEFIIKNPGIMEQRFTGTLINLQLEQVLKCFELSVGIQYEISGKNINENGNNGKTIVILR